MHIGKCVPMIALCLLLCGCKEQVEETDIRAAYREMSGCELTMKVGCGEAQREWVATLQCHYAPEGESTVEVTEPLELAGVRAVLREADWSLEYSDLCLNIGPLSAEQISPATVPVRMLNALLEENTEERQDIPCVRLALEQTGSGGGDIVTTIWLRRADGTPFLGEIAVEGETILTAEFTSFSFCDIISETETEQAGLPREST